MTNKVLELVLSVPLDQWHFDFDRAKARIDSRGDKHLILTIDYGMFNRINIYLAHPQYELLEEDLQWTLFNSSKRKLYNACKKIFKRLEEKRENATKKYRQSLIDKALEDQKNGSSIK